VPERLKLAASLALSLALCACSVAVPPNVRSIGAGLPQKIFLISGQPEGNKSSELQAEFNRQLATALERRGVAVQDGSTFGLTVAVALAPAGIGITQSTGAAGHSVTWSEAPRKKGLFDSCRPQRLRVVVSSGSVAGTPQKLAEGEVSACRITQVQSAALATKLAEDLTRR
jgi:hypothetical protein